MIIYMLHFDVRIGGEGKVAAAIAPAISTTGADKGGDGPQKPEILHGLSTLTTAPAATGPAAALKTGEKELTSTGDATNTGADVPSDRRSSLSTSSSPRDVPPLETGLYNGTPPPSVENSRVLRLEQGVPALPEIDKRDFVPNEGTLVGYCEVRGAHHHE